MLKTRVIPCLLLENEALVKTVNFKNPTYIGDPINAIRIFNEKGVDELVVLDRTATAQKKKPPMELLGKIAKECFMPLAYGGGIRTIEEMREILGLGIEKVVINSYAIENPFFIEQAAEAFGSQSIVVSMDAKRDASGTYELFTHGGAAATGLDPVHFSRKAAELGAGEIFLNSVDRDGAMSGYDLELIEKVSRSVTIPVVACGGAGTIEGF